MRKVHFNFWMMAGLAFAFAGVLCAEDKHDHEKGPHGGQILEVGKDVAHLEVVHNEKDGKMTVYVLGSDAKTAVAVKDALKLNLKTSKGGKQIDMKAVNAKDGLSSQFEATDDALKAHELKGRIVVVIKDKKYNIDLKHDHDH